ncbi:MAG: DUF4870 domain-containing protein [Microcella pacifica]|jgi:uncharacterized Tic20 family protein|uniref:DUF4870 domain-containing protein n=1 Tax=Microcella pacifica TaxID=2591847 RepID=A0A9E5MI48_9MICO|nr:DUF4870 domain-containing protein [Microcella pacifica]MBR23113.1 hypothetical protein [Leifsonia sp.]NHF62313.1 DUF4870 domain-containing protein [Microcella pacifica]
MSQQPPVNPYATAPAPLRPEDEKLWATLIHVGGIFFGFVPALVGYLVLKDRGPFIRGHSMTALNFQLTMLIGYVAGYVLAFVFIGFLVLLAVGVVIIVFGIIAAIAANRGEEYYYPVAIKFLN